MRRHLPWLGLLLAGAATLAQNSSAQAQQPTTPVPPAPQVQPAPALSVVVLDPAHGGSDAGARGATGVLESEVVLAFARLIRAELERHGFRVLLTRQGNENPTFDERSAVANGQRGAVFISLHVSSTGRVGTARAYAIATAATPALEGRRGLVRWDQAQESYAELSRRLAELVQVQFAQKFRGSPEVPAAAPVRQLRTVAAPAIAVEVSSVSAANRGQLEQMAPALAEAVSRAASAFRPFYEAGGR